MGLNKKKFLIIGDVMLDCYINCKVNRISPEAPIPILHYKDTKAVLGGAANVANNISCNGIEVSIIGIIGKDSDGEKINELLHHAKIHDILFLTEDRPTTAKRRFYSNNQQIFRFDIEDSSNISDKLENDILTQIEKVVADYDIVIISDYLKGLLTFSLCKKIIDLCNKNSIPVLVDPKEQDISKYEGCTLIKPNRKEAQAFIGYTLGNSKVEIVKNALKIKELCKCKYLLLTLGDEGMVFVDEINQPHFLNAESQEVYDVTGAGDTVLAFVAMGFEGNSISLNRIELANQAAGIKVKKFGTSIVMLDEILESQNDYVKLIEVSQMRVLREQYRLSGKKVVFTNGCFDVIHPGHVRYLQQAKQQGDILIVGLNSDASVRKLKGRQRPILCVDDRVEILSGLQSVDYIVIFDEDTPLELIKMVQPDILIKGGDYEIEQIVGYKETLGNGGKVMVMGLVSGKSTTNIIEKIRKMENE